MSNSLSVEQLRAQLTALGVDSRGHRNQLRNRLRKKQQQQQSSSNGRQSAPPSYLQQGWSSTERSVADSATTWRRPAVNGAEKVVLASPIASSKIGGSNNDSNSNSNSSNSIALQEVPTKWKPKIDSYLVLDVEATCEKTKAGQPRHASFEFPNEIIEFPVLLLQWRQGQDGNLELYPADIFHTYVKPVWRPKLTQFCKDLTGIEQDIIDAAPSFAEAVDRLHVFLASHKLLEQLPTRQILTRRAKTTSSPALRKGVSWVSHGPYDLLSFVVKQSYISGLAEGVPNFLRGPLIDVKLSAVEATKPRWNTKAEEAAASKESKAAAALLNSYPFRDTTVDGLLAMLKLGDFIGHHHSGLDDTKNIANIFIKVASKVASVAREGEDEQQQQQQEASLQERVADETPPDQSADGTPGVASSHHGRIGNGNSSMHPSTHLNLALAMEQATLLPNTATDKGHMRRWDWMGAVPGKVYWTDPEEEL